MFIYHGNIFFFYRLLVKTYTPPIAIRPTGTQNKGLLKTRNGLEITEAAVLPAPKIPEKTDPAVETALPTTLNKPEAAFFTGFNNPPPIPPPKTVLRRKDM